MLRRRSFSLFRCLSQSPCSALNLVCGKLKANDQDTKVERSTFVISCSTSIRGVQPQQTMVKDLSLFFVAVPMPSFNSVNAPITLTELESSFARWCLAPLQDCRQRR